MFAASVDSGCFVDLFLWMKSLRLKYISCMEPQDYRLEQNHLSQVFSSARISELGHKFRLKWVRLEFLAADFVGHLCLCVCVRARTHIKAISDLWDLAEIADLGAPTLKAPYLGLSKALASL